MRSLIAVLLFFSAAAFAGTTDPANPLEAGNCSLLFGKGAGICASASLGNLGTLGKSWVISNGGETLIVKTKADEAELVSPSGTHHFALPGQLENALREATKGGGFDSMSVDCRKEARACGLAPPAPEDALGDCPVPAVTDPSNLGKLGGQIADLGNKAECSEREKETVKAQACLSGRAVLAGAGKCVANLLWGMFKAVMEIVEPIFGLGKWAVTKTVAAADAAGGTQNAATVRATLDKPERYIEDWWNATEEGENRSSDAMDAAARSSAADLGEAKKLLREDKLDGPEKVPPGLIQRFEEYLAGEITSNFGCLKWSGAPHAPHSRCLEPWKGWECADCWTKTSLSCGVAGNVIGQLPAAMLFARFLKFVTAGAAPALELSTDAANAVQGLLSRYSKVIKAPAEISYFESAVNKAIVATEAASEKIDKAKEVTSDFVMSPLRAAARTAQAKIPSAVVAALSANMILSPTHAMDWYYRQLQMAAARASGGEAKVLSVLRLQASQEVEAAERELDKVYEITRKKLTPAENSLGAPGPAAQKPLGDFGLANSDLVLKQDYVKMPSGDYAQRVWVKRENMVPQERFDGLRTVADVEHAVAPNGEKVIGLGGYSELGYEDPAEMLLQIRKMEEAIPPEMRSKFVIAIGASSEGIGAAYALAKELGFRTAGIISSEGRSYLGPEATKNVDVIVSVQDSTWGGFLKGGHKGTIADLSPTSRAVVGASDRLLYLGGGDVGGAEILSGKEAGMKADFLPFEENHAIATAKALKKNQPAPTNFNGPAEGYIESAPELPFIVKNAQARLDRATLELAKASQAMELMRLESLPEEFAAQKLEELVRIEKAAGRTVSPAKMQELKAAALAAGEQEHAKNLQMAYKAQEVLNLHPTASEGQAAELLAANIHDDWRAARRASPSQIDDWIRRTKEAELDPKTRMAPQARILFDKIEKDVAAGKYPQFEPRIKPAEGFAFTEKGSAVDIANTNFTDLPEPWKRDNEKAARNLMEALFAFKGTEGRVNSSLADAMKAACTPSCSDLGAIARVFKDYKATAAGKKNDPLLVAAAHEFKDWAERTGTRYTHELDIEAFLEATDDLREDKESAGEFKHDVIDPGRNRRKGH
jgi:hypothetical protein